MRLRTRWAWGFAGLGLILYVVGASPGQNNIQRTDSVVQSLENQLDQFFAALAAGQLDEAYESLLADSPALARQPSVVELKEKTQTLEERYGRARGHERIAARRVGQDVVTLTYLYKCATFPVVWHFTYYRTPPSDPMAANLPWRLIALRYDTQVEQLETVE